MKARRKHVTFRRSSVADSSTADVVPQQMVKRRSGMVTALVIVLLMILVAIVSQFMQRVVRDRHQMLRQFHLQQAMQLATAGEFRLRILLKQQPDIQNHTWELPPGTIHQTNSGRVQINLRDGTATIVARYPSNDETPVQISRTIRVQP